MDGCSKLQDWCYVPLLIIEFIDLNKLQDLCYASKLKSHIYQHF